eukprot:Skav207004  [mRNA]  locus=scaffold1554:3058:4146:- [translate_table: standard]
MSGSSGPLFQIARLLGVVASFGESTSAAASQAVNVTGALAVAATDVITAAASNGLSAAENAWRGVDVGDLVAHRCAGLLTVDGPESLHEWLNSSAAPVLIPCLSPTLAEQLVAATSSVALSMPSVQTADESLDMLTHFNATKVWAHLIASGRIQVHYEVVSMSFAVCWANPLWTRMDLELGGEREQILRLLRTTIISLPSPTPSTGIRSIDLEVQVTWPVIRSKLLMLSRSFVLKFSQWFADTLRGSGSVDVTLGLVFLGLLVTFWFFAHKLSMMVTTTHDLPGEMLPLVDLTEEDDDDVVFSPPSHPGFGTEATHEERLRDSSSSGESSFSLVSAERKRKDSEVSSENSYLFEGDAVPNSR